MYKWFESMVRIMERLSALIFEYKYPTFALVWCMCFVLLLSLYLTEAFGKYVKGKQYIDQDILRRIFTSIESSNTNETLQLLQKYPQYVNCFGEDHSYTPFLLACYHGQTALVKYMILNGTDCLRSRTDRNESPFFLAVAHLINNPFSIDASCLRELYYSGCNVNEPNCRGYTPLHLAAYFGHKTLIKWLLNKGADVRVDPSPADVASNRGHVEAAYILSNWDNKRRMITSS